MSDLAESFFIAWNDVMAAPSMRLYCTWHVDRCWRKNIKCKIQGVEKQGEVYKQIRTLMHEQDVDSFDEMLNIVLERLECDPDTVQFATYFRDNYVGNANSWAYCHRLNAGIITNMHTERMHRTIKYIYLGSKCVKRLDKAIFALMSFVKHKLFDRLIVLNKGKLTSKLKDIRLRHKSGNNIKEDFITMEFSGWKVRSSSRRSTDYFVYDNDFQCNCRLMCIKCRACIHRYSCTCIDYTIKWNMCKHIHSVCRIQLKQQPSEHLRNSEVTLTESEDISVVDEKTEILAEVTKKSVNDSVPLSVQRRELIAEFSGIVSELTSNDLETAKKMLSSLKATVAVGMFQQKQAPLQIERKQSQKILPQRRLYSTKKNKRSNNASLVLPNSEESSLIKLSLLADKEDALVGKGSAVKKQPTIKNTEGVAGPFPITACALQHSPTNRSTPMIQPIAKQAEVVSSPSLATSYVLKHSPRNSSTSTIQPIPKQAVVVPHPSIGTVRVLLHSSTNGAVLPHLNQ
ncbi:uncharacterized protein LOC126484546 [Schistocerca serialis cubense]|uniref:uncharacterized protein LOC126484546 n=1 Tax=Schistocerca serialis cubense TaxID=2023355 RepID=UPI00214E9223|nr:uncharacterized protein LOC126484546 [Schistocerca serialis cubense]